MVQNPLTAFRLESRQTINRDVPVLCGAHDQQRWGVLGFTLFGDASMFHGIINLMTE